MKKILSLMMAAAMALSLAACGASSTGSSSATSASGSGSSSKSSGEKITIRYADVQAENDVETLFANKFSEIVAEKSDGRIDVQVYPSGQMGEMTDIFNSVQMGSIEMCRTNPSWLADAGAASMNLLSLPFVYKDVDHMNTILDGDIGSQMLQELTDKNIGVHGLGFLQASGRYFFFKGKEVASLNDVKGLKIRVPTNSLSTKMVEDLGASATPISYNELYSSLQTNVVDGADNPLKGIVNMSFFEVSSYILDLAHQYEPSVILVSGSFWDKLSADDQAILQDAMTEASEYYKEISNEQLDGYRSTLEEKGMTFVTPTDPQEWMDAVTPMYGEFTKGYEDMFAQIQALQKD
ncbi:MAG: TRAP transporter substrate-binding protein [Oscillibacter sp.]|jgi:tripartite ATP-independent transporter DctP family solute receptor|nr:TRAP transporter substrate-binding protein [Oscillibacter sp.]